MNRATPQLRRLARQLIVSETLRNTSSKAKNPAAFHHVTEKLRPHLATLMGSGGFRALLSRALALAQAEVPWLRAVHVQGAEGLEGLEDLQAQLDSTEFLEGRVVLLAQLLGLLVAFIGPSLTSRLIAGLTFEQQVSKCRAQAAEAKSLAADGRDEKAEQYLDFAAKWSDHADEMERFAYERRMKPGDASAIAAFQTKGGQIVKVPEAILVTEQDMLDFLASCGVTVRCSGSEPKVYWCEGRRVRLSHVVDLANCRRRSQQLPAFAVQD